MRCHRWIRRGIVKKVSWRGVINGTPGSGSVATSRESSARMMMHSVMASGSRRACWRSFSRRTRPAMRSRSEEQDALSLLDFRTDPLIDKSDDIHWVGQCPSTQAKSVGQTGGPAPCNSTPPASSLSGFALHAAKQTAGAVWLGNDDYRETFERWTGGCVLPVGPRVLSTWTARRDVSAV